MCDSRELTPADSKSVRKVITQAAGGREVLWPSIYACANPGSASVNVDVKPEPQPDGSRLNFYVDCDRARTKWTCELDHVRYAHVEMDIEGRQTTFELHIPEDFDFRRVKPLIVRASEAGSKTTVEQACDYQPKDPDPRAAGWLLNNQRAFKFSEPTIAGEIEDHDGLVSLILFDELLIFTPDPREEFGFIFKCWTFQIIVT
jgi:hypothetical protein